MHKNVLFQEIFTCTNRDDSIDCMESPQFYSLNRNFGDNLKEEDPQDQIDDSTSVPEVHQNLEKHVRRPSYESKRKALESDYK